MAFEELAGADLRVDQLYEGGHGGNLGDDPLARLLPVGNQGGFRYQGSPRVGACTMVVLYSSGMDPDWPDFLDPATGRFVYYGDNKKPGRPLHSTQRGGNELLRQCFEVVHGDPTRRHEIPPFLVFWRAEARNVFFRGLAAPGASDLTPNEDLVAIWRSSVGGRFQNYRAAFTILDVDVIPRAWLEELSAGERLANACPPVWREWAETGVYRALQAHPTLEYRTQLEQLPTTEQDRAIIFSIYEYFRHDPHGFEQCAARIWQMMAPQAGEIDVTRPSRDGGRDAVGYYALGPEADPVRVDFALEAKCYELQHGVGVRELSRLISRLRHRQFGVLVTTSFVSLQAYRELREDAHPVVIISARDIVDVLKRQQIATPASARLWLQRTFAAPSTGSAT